MNLYESRYLSIQLVNNGNRIVAYWISSPTSLSDFKKEMLKFLELYERFKPCQSLWLQENFTFQPNEETLKWIEEEINKPCVLYGNKKVAMVVGRDILAHLNVLNGFEKNNTSLTHAHFATEKDAVEWLDQNTEQELVHSKPEISFEGVDRKGNVVINIKNVNGDISRTIKSFQNLAEENSFIKNNIEKYTLLTKREKQILSIYAKGLKHQDIADILFISLGTLRTHWKNIKRKLDIKSIADVINYVNAFNIRS